jgi:large subunit ribosomal protein L13
MQAAVKGMLPKSKLGTKLLLKMKMYTGAEHPHAPQKPESLILN